MSFSGGLRHPRTTSCSIRASTGGRSSCPRVEWCLTPFDARCGVSGLHYGHAVQVEPASTEERAAMARALEEARAAGRAGEVRVGAVVLVDGAVVRAEEHTSGLQPLMRISYADFGLKKKKKTNIKIRHL